MSSSGTRPPGQVGFKEPAITLICRLLEVLLSPWTRPNTLPAHPRRAVIIRPCCLGDILLTTAAVRALAEALPTTRLDYLTGAAARAGLVNNPHLTEIIELTSGPGGYLAALRRLRARRYDLALVLDRAPHWALLTWLAGIPIRAGLDSLHRGLGLTHRVRPQPGQHEARLAQAVVASLGLPIGDAREEYRPSPAAQDRIAAWLGQTNPARPLVVIHPAGGINQGMTMLAKRWPAERFAELINLLQRGGATVVLTGASSDRSVLESIQAALPPDGRRPCDLAGQLNLDEHAALAAAADLYIGHDSGPTHLAAATGTPTVAIFGPTDPGTYAPPGDHVLVVWHGAWLDPAIDLRDRVVDASAILAVRVGDVWQAVLTFLPDLTTRPLQAGEEGL